MANRNKNAKREEWRRRLERFESKDQSIAGFCRAEGVGVHRFYYWSKQLGQPGQNGQQPTPVAGSGQAGAMAADSSRVVRFTWESGLSFSVPADCLDAIRCVLEYASEQQVAAESDKAGSPRFRQVIVG